MKIKFKLYIILLVPISVSTIIGLIIAGLMIEKSQIKGLEDKSMAILTRMEAVREFVGRQENLVDFTKMIAMKSHNNQISESDRKLIPMKVPIIASWTVGMQNAQKDNYTFKIASFHPRNPRNEPNELEAEFLHEFESTNIESKSFINKETNELWVMREITLKESDGCLVCHGNPDNSPWGNGKDILGYNMENWKDGQQHGMFLIKSDLTPIQASVNKTIFNMTFWSILIMLITISLGYTIVRRINVNIILINKLVRKIGDGNYNVKLDTSGKDEFSELSVQINAMVDSQKLILSQLSQFISKLSSSTRFLNDTAMQISDGAQSQASQYEELTSSIESSSQNANKANILSRKSANEASEANKRVITTREALDEIAISSEKITNAINIITEMSIQTNLLALNAGVEAARAGQQGKGFGVIAAEIKKLADRSKEAAKGIKETINESRIKITNGVIIAKESESYVTKIIHQLQENALEIDIVSSSLKEQNSSMHQASNITIHNAADAEKLASAALELENEMDKLNDLISKFQF